MSYRYEKETGDIVIDGWEKGIAASPHKGIANLQNVNTSTETGEAMCSFQRVQQSQVIGSGTLTQVDTSTVSISGVNLLVGTWITIQVDSGTGLSGHYYYVDTGKLSTTFAQDNSTEVTGIMPGSATFTLVSFGNPLFSATEPYFDENNMQQYRYYIVDATGHVWVHDTSILVGITTPEWFLPDPSDNSANPLTNSVTGLAVLNGWLVLFVGNNIFWKPTVTLGMAFTDYTGSGIAGNTMTKRIHFTLTSHTGRLYYTDGNFVGSIFPDTSTVTGMGPIESYCEYTASTTTGTVTDNIGGSLPTLLDGVTRIPAVFLSDGTLPAAITPNTIYFIDYATNTNTFKVYDVPTGGSPLDIETGSSGNQFFNTFHPDQPTLYAYVPQAVVVPFFESAQSLAELGTNVMIGTASNALYSWDQIAPTPSAIIFLPENDTVNMIIVNNMLYVFSGHKGNIYITNGSSASPVITVPDYCAGISGAPKSYIEPYFSWGGAAYIRGRVYFSILDQTSAKAGNCGGIWSFIPTQNFFVGQDDGMSLRLENQNSYGTYNGVAQIIISSGNQDAIAPQYWSAWYSSITSPVYGIDFTGTVPVTTATFETDLIETGTFLTKQTFKQFEYKVSSPLVSGESVSLYYRRNSTEFYRLLSNEVVNNNELSGYFNANFQRTQWIQLKAILTSTGDSTSSFVRITELRIR